MQIHELNNFTGTLGSGAYLAVDNGTDTGKISSQGLLAATEARIDNIIAGPAPSAEEIVDARLGDDGVTYPSLGDAIRDQVGDLKSAFVDVEGKVDALTNRVFFGYLYGSTLDWSLMLDQYAEDYSLQSSAYNSTANTIIFAFSAVDGSNSVLLIEVDKYYNVLQRNVVQLYHANDITFNPLTGKIYVSNDTINGQIDVVNATNLSLESPITVSLSSTISQVSYDKLNNIYYVCTSDRKIYTLDSQFNNAKYITDLEYNSNPASFGHDYVKSVYYQGSEVIGGRFIYLMWLYGEDNSDSFARLYSINVSERKNEDFVEIPMKRGTYEESECLVVIGNRAYLYGYINGKIITTTELFINGNIKDDWSFVQHLPLCSESGSIVSFPDGAYRVNADSLKIDLNYISGGRTGIIVNRTGKNLIKNEASSTTANGITFTVYEDGTVNANGTSSALTVFNLNLNISKLVTNERYILSGCTGGNFGTTYALRIINSGGSSLTINNDGDTGFIKTAAMTRLQIIIWSGQTLNNVVFKPMIRLQSESDSTYEGFVGNEFTINWNEIAGTIYGGTLDATNGLLTSTKASDGTDLASPIKYQIKPIPLNTLLGRNNIWLADGNVSVKYRADILRYINKMLGA